MKNTWSAIALQAALWMLISGYAGGQKIDDARMERDVEVAENVLNTLIKQKLDNKRNYWSPGVEGSYMPGYGVIFRIPNAFGFGSFDLAPLGGVSIISSGGGSGYSYSISSDAGEMVIAKDKRKEEKKPVAVGYGRSEKDSMRSATQKQYYEKVIEASKEFLADYGDFITQLKPDERIMITNRGEEYKFHFFGSDAPKRTLLSIEAMKGDLLQFRQGKMTRDQMLSKIKVVNTETEETLSPDLELLSSIISRLYRSDLSKTFFTSENVYYERMKDFGVIYYLNVQSSVRDDDNRHRMPTLGIEDLDQAARDKKVVELYPDFERDIKENMLEYGRTLKSLNDDESLIMQIKLTKCDRCGIPSSLELSVKNEVLRAVGTGNLTKEAAMTKINVKKGPNQ